MNNSSLANTLAVITGSGSGNGKSIAHAFLNAGSHVIGVDIKLEDCSYTENIIGDITNTLTISKVLNRLEDLLFENLVLVNNAGITLPVNDALEYPLEYWNKTIEVNLTAPYLWIEALKPIFRRKKSGSIINITSLAAERAFPDNPSYIASKGGLKMLGKYYAKCLGAHGTRVNNVGPGYIATPMTYASYNNEVLRESRSAHTFLGRWGKPEDLNGVCLFLASDASKYITGQDIYVDGGWLSNGLVQL